MDIETLKSLDDRKLKDFLLMGEKAFEVGIYNLYKEEANKRGMDLSFLEYMTPEKVEIDRKNKTIRLGYTFAVLGGILGIVIGLYIVNKKKYFDKNERMKGFKIIITSIVMFLIWTIIKILFSLMV